MTPSKPVQRRVVVWGVNLSRKSPLVITQSSDCVLLIPSTKDVGRVLKMAQEFDPHLILCSGPMICDLMGQALGQRPLGRSTEPVPTAHLPVPKLTEREMQILVLLQQGMTNRGIAHEYGLSTRTVKGYFTVLFEKFGVSGRTELLGIATKLGLVPAAAQQAGAS